MEQPPVNLRTLPLGKGKPAAKPLLTFVVLLSNGKTLEQPAHEWCENTGDEGDGIAYYFYVDKLRVLALEYSEVRAVLCKEHCDVDQALQALKPVRKPRARKA